MLSVIARRVIMLSVYMPCHDLYCYAECGYAKCHYAECRYMKCCYSECHYVMSFYDECYDAMSRFVLLCCVWLCKVSLC